MKKLIQSATSDPNYPNIKVKSLGTLARNLGYTRNELADWFELLPSDIVAVYYNEDNDDATGAKTIWDTYVVTYSGRGIKDNLSYEEMMDELNGSAKKSSREMVIDDEGRAWMGDREVFPDGPLKGKWKPF